MNLLSLSAGFDGGYQRAGPPAALVGEPEGLDCRKRLDTRSQRNVYILMYMMFCENM